MTTKHARLLILSAPARRLHRRRPRRARQPEPGADHRPRQGGQLMTTTEVDNWPADADGVMGPDLMARFQKHAERFNTEMIFDHIHTVKLGEKPFRLIGDSGRIHLRCADHLHRRHRQYLGLPSEEKFAGRGVSACATCDGFFYRNQDVAVIGGGNTAVEEALYLANIARKVT